MALIILEGVLATVLRGRLPAVVFFVILLFFLFVFGIDAVGLLSVDEPRYAAIGREMAWNGDFITPRLWGEPWFEKPPLLFWMIGLATWLGLDNEWAARLPVALVGIAFLVLFCWRLRSEFGEDTALFATLVLGSSGGWVVYSQIAVTDLPLAATFGTAMLLCLPWAVRGERTGLKRAGALFGLAVLAKGLVAPVLAAPLLWFGRRRLKDLIVPAAIGLAVALPWYALCYAANGRVFVEEFLWKHHFERFTSDSLQHVQPFWFYLPVLLGALFPWTPALAALRPRTIAANERLRYLAVCFGWGFVFFSVSTNKLPGYLLPLVPLLAVLLGAALASIRRAGPILAACALLLALAPVAAGVLPQAVLRGLSRAEGWSVSATALLLPGAVAALVWLIDHRGRRRLAVCVLFAAVTVAVVHLKVRTYPALDEQVSARDLWRRIERMSGQICLDQPGRHWTYGLNYYALQPLPECAEEPRDWRLRLDGEGRPVLAPSLSF